MNKQNKKLFKTLIISYLAVAAAGTLLHFAYEWTGENVFVGLFSAVNESVWEHTKLLFIPFLIASITENIIYGKSYPNFFFSRLVGALGGIFTIVTVHYTYSGIIGRRIAFIDVALYYIALLVSYGISAFLLMRHSPKSRDNILEIVSILSLGAICTLYFVFTYFTPSLGIFISPTGS